MLPVAAFWTSVAFRFAPAVILQFGAQALRLRRARPMAWTAAVVAPLHALYLPVALLAPRQIPFEGPVLLILVGLPLATAFVCVIAGYKALRVLTDPDIMSTFWRGREV
jgi:hypothetical protein